MPVGGGREALYVDTLILRAKTTVTLNYVHVYYKTLIDEGASIVTIGNGTLSKVGTDIIVPATSWGRLLLALILLLAAPVIILKRNRRHEAAEHNG